MAAKTTLQVFRCGQCRQPLRARPADVGRRFRCVHCGACGKVPPLGTADDPAAQADEHLPEADTRLGEGQEFSFRRQSQEDDGMDMTPMVDVTFLLLIFFMITASFSLQKSQEMPALDRSEAVSQRRTIEELEQDDDYIIVRIDQDSVIWVDEHEAPTRHELLAQLRDLREAGPKAPSNLLVYAHGDALHEKVVMVLDVGNALGFEHVRIAADEADQ